MNWRIKLAAWLLRSFIADAKPKHELLIFVDPCVLDFEGISNLQQQSPDSVLVTFIPVRPRYGVPVGDSIVAVPIPKQS